MCCPTSLFLRGLAACYLFEKVYGLFGHGLRIVHIGLQRSLDICVAKADLHVLYICPGFNEQGGMGMPQGVVVKGKQQLLMNHPCTELEGVRGGVFPVFGDTDHPDAGQG